MRPFSFLKKNDYPSFTEKKGCNYLINDVNKNTVFALPDRWVFNPIGGWNPERWNRVLGA
jgi:hypothetical protein